MSQATKAGPQVNKLHIDRRIRRILLFEILFVIFLYAILFLLSSLFLGQQTTVTDQILSRFQMVNQVQSVERLMIQNSNLVRSYRLSPEDKKFETIVLNHSQFSDLLDKTKDRLETLKTSEASNLKEEIKLSDELIKNYLEIVSNSNALVGKNVLTAVAAHKARNSLNREFPVAPTDKSPAELESELVRLEEDSVNIAANWRTLAEQDITRLTDKLAFSQNLRAAVLVLQALLVIIGLVVISYTYVLPSFEKILKQVIVQNEELLRADGMKTEFLSIASHQLRTPLSVIKWALSAILKSNEEKNLTGPQQQMLQEAKNSADSVIDLVGNLLNLSRIEQGRLEMHPSLTELLPIIQQVVRDVMPIAAKKQVQVAESHSVEGALAEVDPLLFKEVVQNLVDNAVSYNREKGLVKVTLRAKNKGFVVDVADTGYGIMPEDMQNLFTKFYRGANARTIRPNGSGIGLYFIKKIVQLHGGKISVESEPDRGTVFSVYFPAKVKGGRDETAGEQPNFTGVTSDKVADAKVKQPAPALGANPTPQLKS